MQQRPAITVSARDVDRLSSLLDRLDDDHPGKADLLAELDRANIVEPEAMPANVVTMNSTVRFRVVDSAREFSMTLVYPRDQSLENSISVMAPVGSALLGMTAGDTIAWPKPGGGTLQLEIVEVTYQPERSGEFHR